MMSGFRNLLVAVTFLMGFTTLIVPATAQVLIADRDAVEESVDSGADHATSGALFKTKQPDKKGRHLGTKASDYIAATEADGVDVRAKAGDDLVLGSPGDDVIRGGSGDDNLAGYEGNDVIHGGSGHNLVNGGAGKDTFFVKGLDKIEDLEVGDVLKHHAKLQYEATKVGKDSMHYENRTGTYYKKWMPVHTMKSLDAMMPDANAVANGVAALHAKLKTHTRHGFAKILCDHQDRAAGADTLDCLISNMQMFKPADLDEWREDLKKIQKDEKILNAKDTKTKVGLLLDGYSAVVVDSKGTVKHMFSAHFHARAHMFKRN